MCEKSCTYGSVGASNGHPYRDRWRHAEREFIAISPCMGRVAHDSEFRFKSPQAIHQKQNNSSARYAMNDLSPRGAPSMAKRVSACS